MLNLYGDDVKGRTADRRWLVVGAKESETRELPACPAPVAPPPPSSYKIVMVDNNYGGHVLFIIYYTFTTINQQNERTNYHHRPTRLPLGLQDTLQSGGGI